MVTKDNNDCLEYINSFKIRVIKDEVRFWMVRTKKGYFYDEFISNRFIALGWNVITKSTDMGAQSLDALKKEISNVYGDAKPAGSISAKILFMIFKKGIT
jgi:predicted Mrr-cat superfamily restriction endonuclease